MGVLLGSGAVRYAVACARRGWSVVPLHTPEAAGCSCRRPACPAVGKHPRVRWDERMDRPATEAEVIAWWRRWPDANVGVVTGAVSGLAVVDVDPRNGGEATLAALEARHGPLPRTLEVETGGGGRHLWYAIAGTGLPSAILGPGVDLKGDGGLVVVPPSLHASGRRYAWVAGSGPAERDAAPLPGWLAAPREERHHQPSPGPAPPRTDAERRVFAAAWDRAGLRLEAGDACYRCPFHPDAHPSLHVDPAGCRWFCFGCRRGGGTGALLALLGERRPVAPRPRLRAEVGSRSLPTLEGDARLEVVGESHHQDELLALAGRRPYGGVELTALAELVPEPDHPVDPLAVAVRIDGRPVGYLRHEDARRLHGPVVDARRRLGRATCRAVVRGGWDRGRADVGRFGVTLLVPPAWVAAPGGLWNAGSPNEPDRP